MTDSLHPALTPEEWRDGYVHAPGFIRDTNAGLFDWGVRVTAQTDDGADVIGSDRHALAALCLYDQSFGFEQCQVDLLRWVADNWRMVPFAMGGFGSLSQPDLRPELLALADRIAALLPPESFLCSRTPSSL